MRIPQNSRAASRFSRSWSAGIRIRGWVSQQVDGEAASEDFRVVERAEFMLVRQAQRGDRACFGRLWERYSRVVNTILLTMVQQSDADDLTQDVAIAALRALPTLHDPHCFPSWLCAIARNLGRNALQARRRPTPCSLSELGDAEAPRADEAGSIVEASEVLAQIRCLPACYREPLTLRLMLGLTGPEIAVKTGMTEGAVRVNLCRGMKLLRWRLSGWLE